MEMILFCGLQGSGKSTFYKRHFYDTHLRINLDMLRTRRREGAILDASLRTGQRFVVDNTNPTVEERKRYLQMAGEFHFSRIIYYFDVPAEICIARNAKRTGRALISERGILATKAKFEVPSLVEGFERLFRVDIDGECLLLGETDNAV